MSKFIQNFLLVNAGTLSRELIFSWEKMRISGYSPIIWKIMVDGTYAYGFILWGTTLYLSFGYFFCDFFSDSSTLLTAFICSPAPLILFLVPVVTYSNPVIQKKAIYSENKGKSGIYLWRNKINGKIYIGSSVDLRVRLKCYFSAGHLERQTSRYKSAIYSSLLKNGYENFRLEILKYCSPEKCIKWEQFYIDLLSPEYNILKIAGSTLGRTHTEESKNKISAHMKGIPRSEEHKEKISLGNPNCKKIEVNYLESNTSTIYNSMGEAAKSLNLSSHKIISQYISRKQQIPYKGRYIFRRVADG